MLTGEGQLLNYLAHSVGCGKLARPQTNHCFDLVNARILWEFAFVRLQGTAAALFKVFPYEE